MNHNALFNFIERRLPEVHAIVRALGATVVRAESTRGQSYFRIQLPHAALTPISDGTQVFSVTEHHLSIYALEDKRNAALSQYHYTATLKDERRDSLSKLHVYFKENEQLAKPPVLTRPGGAAGDSAIALGDDLSDEFIIHATTQAKEMISLLRQKSTLAVQEHLTHYNALELKARELSTTMEDSLVLYIKTLEEMTLILAELIELTNSSKYRAECNFLRQMIDSLSKKPRECDTYEAPPTESLFAPEDEAACSGAGLDMFGVASAAGKPGISPTPKSKGKSPTPITKTKSSVLAEELPTKVRIHALIAEYEALKPEDKLAYARTLNTILAKLYELSFLVSTSDESIAQSSLIALQQLHTTVQKAGERFVSRCFLESEFEVVNELPSFHHMLNSPLLTIALARGDDKQLDFLLTRGDFQLDEQVLVIKGVHYNSPLHYCCATFSDTPSKKRACIEVLLKHKASFLAPGSNGLPLAHNIWMSLIDNIYDSTFSLLRKVLFEADQFFSVTFFKELIARLQRHISRGTASTEEVSRIYWAIEDYKSRLKFLQSATTSAAKGHESIHTLLRDDKAFARAAPTMDADNPDYQYGVTLALEIEDYQNALKELKETTHEDRQDEITRIVFILNNLLEKYTNLFVLHLEAMPLSLYPENKRLNTIKRQMNGLRKEIEELKAMIRYIPPTAKTADTGGAGGSGAAVTSGWSLIPKAALLMHTGLFAPSLTPLSEPPSPTAKPPF